MAILDVSVCLIVKDARETLPRCLDSVRGLVRETTVVDTGSVDGSIAVAEAFGCRVLRFPWVDDFAAARNESLRHAAGRWVLWLDADEHLDGPNRRKLADLFASLPDEDAAYAMTMRSVLPNGSLLDLQHVRLFRNHPEIRWKYRVHEQIAPAVVRLGHPVRPVDVVFQHTGYQDPRVRRGKLERNARLLELDLRDHPDDAYLLYNLGTAYADLGQLARAVPLLQRSLWLSPPEHSTVRDACAALLQCHWRLGQVEQAWAVCREARRRFPADVVLLFWQAQMLRNQGDLSGAEKSLRELIGTSPGRSFGAADAGVRKHLAPHSLGLVYYQQGRVVEAEEQWRAVVAECPAWKDSWLMLAEAYLGQQRWADLEAVLGRLEETPAWAADGAVLRARLHLARRNFTEARAVLEKVIARTPAAPAPRVYLTHVLLAEGKDWRAAEDALRELLSIDPGQGQGWYNLTALLHSQGRPREAREAWEAGWRTCPGDPNLGTLRDSICGEVEPRAKLAG